MPPVALPDARVLVHIGLHKTGTTWLQQHFFSCEAYGFWSPLEAGASAKERVKAVGRMFLRDGRGRLIADEVFDATRLRERLSAYRVPDGLCAVTSAQRLSGHPLSNGFDRAAICRRIKDVFPNARILMVIREQRAMILSSYMQYLHRGGRHSLRFCVNPPWDHRLPVPDLQFWKYDRLIAMYQQAFGPENVLVLPYEMLRDRPQQYIAHICLYCGLAPPPDLPFARRSNARSQYFTDYHLRWMSFLLSSTFASHYNPAPFRRKLASIIARRIKQALATVVPEVLNQRTKDRLDCTIERMTRDVFVESNRRVEALMGIALADYGYDV